MTSHPRGESAQPTRPGIGARAGGGRPGIAARMGRTLRPAAGLLALTLLAACGNAGDLTRAAPEPAPTVAPTAAPTGPATQPTSPSGAPPEADLSAAQSEPVDDPYYPQHGEPYLDTLHYQLDLDWRPASQRLEGQAAITFRVTEPRSRIRLDFGKPLDVTAAHLDGADVRTAESGEELVVRTPGLTPGDQHTLTISYAGSPQPVPAPVSRSDITTVGWHTEPDGSAWTMQEPWGAYTWYPVNDHPSDKAYYDATITAPGGMIGVFNGQLVDQSKHGDETTTRWHLDAPAASYLITIAIGRYTQEASEGPDGLPVSFWLPAGEESATEWLDETPDMLRWLERRLGDYPFESIGVVLVPSKSGMETQTLVTIGDGLFHTDAATIRGDLLHEYAHQWYGDLVTPNNWTDLWLNEAFAMYIQLLWCDKAGLWDYDQMIALWTANDGQLRAEYGPPGAYAKDDFASSNVYISGALMLDRIRGEIGDHAFFDALRAWPTEHRYGNADRDDYIEWLSDRTGTDLEPLVDAWLTSPTSPNTP